MIVCHLLGGELYSQELLELLGTTKGNISQHLTALMRQKIIARQSRGRHNYYRIADDTMKSLIAHLKKLYCPDFEIPTLHRSTKS
jgi:DNA-binding transcriptional ArsR family regulator